jgi:acylphosphatase
MQTRAKIIVKGNVQRVGYRDAVEKIAGKLKKRWWEVQGKGKNER